MTTDITHRSNWAAQRLQGGSERKNNFAKTGEMLVGGAGRVTSSDFNKALVNDFPLDPKKPATMKYGGSMMDNTEEFFIDNKNSRKNIKPKLPGDDNYQKMNNELNRDISEIDKTLSQKTKALDAYSQTFGYSQPHKDFTKPSFVSTAKAAAEKKQELYTSPTGPDDYEDFSPSNIPSRIPKNTLSSSKTKLTQPNNAAAEEFGFQFNKPKLSKNYEDESPTSPALLTSLNKPTFEPAKPLTQKVQEKPNFQSSAQKEKASEGLLPKLSSTSKSSINSTASSNFTQDKEKEKEKDVDYSKAFSKPSFKKAPTLPAARPEPKKRAATKIPNEDVHQDRGPLKECPHGCGRSFALDALEVHAKACQKVFQNKRKAFDAGQKRATDEMTKTMTSGFGAKGQASDKNKDGKWKEQSEALREKLKQAKSKEEAAKIQAQKQQEEVGQLKPCPHGCGRSFNEEAFEKHAKVCQKVFQNKRQQFDAGQKRATDDMAKTMSGFGAAGKGKADKAEKDGKWKEQSEALREKLKQAKSKEEAAKIQAQKQQEEVGQLRECPHGCGRSFNEEAFEKHAKICQKVFQNKREKFDAGQKRITDDMAQTMTSGFGAKGQAGDKNKDGKWKEQSEALRANIKAAAAAKADKK